MKISHIVTNGCSFTYCQGLSDKINQGWPALIANGLNCPVVNLGLPGVGNDSIHRRTYEYIYENQPVDEYKPLVIIEWTQRWRTEEWLNRENDYIIIHRPESTKFTTNSQLALMENYNEENFLRKTILYRLSLINLFENLEIPYLMFDYDGAYDPLNTEKIVSNIFPNMIKQSSNKFDLGPLYKLTGRLPKLPCGHDDVDGQDVLGNHILKKIKEIYPNIEYTNNANFLNLKEFSKTSKYHRKFPEWCNFQLKSAILP
jgi:hypothetical protein